MFQPSVISTTALPDSTLSLISLIPLGLGADLLMNLISSVALGIINLFTNLLVDLIAVFLFFPNPSTLFGLDELWFTSLTAFMIIWIMASLSWFGTMQVFPYNENITPWRFVERSIIAFIAVIISRPALALVIELVNMIGQYIFPVSFGFTLANSGLQNSLGTLTGAGMVFLVSLVVLYSVSVAVVLLFLGVLSMRALVIYTVYATFPIWMGLWIVDEGPLKYGHQVSQVVFRAFAMLLGIGIFVSAILATGGAVAQYSADTDGGTSATASATDTGTHINEKHLSPIKEPPDSGTASSHARNTIVLSLIGIYGSLWGAFGVTSSILGMMISVGGGATSRASGRMQRGMPGGGAQTQTDRGSPTAGGAGGGGGGGGIPPGATPGSHGNGPGESTGYVSSNDVPSQTSRSISEQAGMAYESGKEAMSTPSETMSSAASSARDSASSAFETMKNSPTTAGKKAVSGVKKGAKAFDTTADLIANGSNQSVMHGVENKLQDIREDPIVGGEKDASEMLDDHNASFIDDGEFAEGDLNIRFDEDHGWHPNSAEGWEQAHSENQEVFTEMDADNEIYRGYKTGKGDHVMVASADDVDAEAVHMTGSSYYQVSRDSSLDVDVPYAEYDAENEVIVANEKQGRSLEELDPHDEFARKNLDSETYVDQVAAGMIVGDERAAQGDVLFDEDGKAFNPNVDGAGEEFSMEEMNEMADEAAKAGIASKEEILDRVDEATNELYDAHKGDEHSSGDPFQDVASDASHWASKDVYDKEVAHSGQETLVDKRNNIKNNLGTASALRQRYKTK